MLGCTILRVGAILCLCLHAGCVREWIVDSNESYADAQSRLSVGDTVTMMSGVYSGNKSCGIAINASYITLRAQVPGSVTINCNNSSRHLTLSGSNIILHGIIFVDGFSQDSGGCIFLNQSDCIIQDCNFSRCSSSSNGGGIVTAEFVRNVTISSAVFKFCSAAYGGAIFLTGAAFARLQGRSNFQYNKALSNGGGIYLSDGAGIEFNTSSTNFTNNIVNLKGGAIYVGSACNFLLSGVALFANNSAISSSGAGGALFITNSSVMLTGNSDLVFRDNICLGSGGAVALFSGSTLRALGAIRFIGRYPFPSLFIATLMRSNPT
jgi:predicted outer membrane repeat protein